MADWAPKRFWTQTSVINEEGNWTVRLDNRPVKTPAKAPLVVPTEAMAQAIAKEWQAQGEKIDPRTMPMTRSANAAIDKVIPQMPQVVAMIAEYGTSDLLCYRAESPEGLIERQAVAWDPLLEWAASELNAPLKVMTGVMYAAQPDESLAALGRALAGFNAFEITAMGDLVSLSGSLVIGLAVARGLMPASELWDRSRIDENWQTEHWGFDDEAVAVASLKHGDFLHAARLLIIAR
ncbi:MAG: chaperone required for assembly of F1-ATPase [Paracoccaceae bacterium]|jgi:chaperone required for assembly of F1-ATPase